jgi:pyruvate dehydrogenase (quinone)
MLASGIPDWQTQMKNPNFAKLAEAVGVRGIRIEKASEVESSIKCALQHKGPVLIDAVTDPNVISLPPDITLSEMEGFSLGMSKMALSGHIDAVLDTIKSNWRSL